MNQYRQPTLRSSQIAMVVLMSTLLLATATMVGLRLSGVAPQPAQHQAGQLSILLIVLVSLCVIETPIFFILPGVILKNQARKMAEAASEEDRETIVLTALQIVTTLRGALAQGLGMFGSVIYLIDGEPLALIAPGVTPAMMAMLMPTRDKKDALRRKLALPV